MTDPTTTPGYQPTEIEATRGREQGLGMGARDLAQQRDVGDTVAAPEEERDFQSADQDADDEILDTNTSVLGVDEDDEGDEDDTGYVNDDAGKDV